MKSSFIDDIIAKSICNTGNNTKRYIHTQSTLSKEWEVNHNLGFLANSKVYYYDGIEFEALITNVDENNVKIEMNKSLTGYVICT